MTEQNGALFYAGICLTSSDSLARKEKALFFGVLKCRHIRLLADCCVSFPLTVCNSREDCAFKAKLKCQVHMRQVAWSFTNLDASDT